MTYDPNLQNTDVPSSISVPKGWVITQLDARLQYGTAGAMPAIGTVDDGTLYYQTDTGYFYQAQGGAWVKQFDMIKTTDNFALGINALQHLSTGQRNMAIGFNALHAVTSASENTAFGYNALQALTTGLDSGGSYGNNTAIGAYALQSGSFNSSQNTAIGSRALYYCADGLENTAVGHMAGAYISSGDLNTAVGQNALMFATTSSWNTAVGSECMMSDVTNKLTGVRNSGLGNNCMWQMTTGSENIGMGHWAGQGTTSGHNNTYLGTEAGYTGNGDHNICLGAQAGYYETGTGKLFINSYLTASEAQDRSLSIIYGVMTGNENTQELYVNGILHFGNSSTYSVDHTATADQVTLGAYEISAGNRVLDISQEKAVVTEAVGASDRTLTVRINGATLKIMLHT